MGLRALLALLNGQGENEKKQILAAFNDKSSYSSRLVDFLLNEAQAYKTVDVLENAAIKSVYGKNAVVTGEAFRKLVLRTRNKVLDEVLFNIYRFEDEGMEDVVKARMEVSKKCILFKHLYFKDPMSEMAFVLLNEIITLSRQFEMDFVLLQYLDIKIHLELYTSDNEQKKKLQEELLFYKRRSDALQMAKELDSSLSYHISHIKSKVDVDAVKKQLKHLVREQKVLNSDCLAYLIFQIRLQFHFFRNEYKTANKLLKELHELLLASKSIHSRQRIGKVLASRAICEVEAGNFSKGIVCLKEALEIFKPGSRDFNSLKQIEFYCYVYSRKFNRAKEVLTEIKDIKDSQSEFEQSKVNYLFGFLEFCTGNFSEAKHIFHTNCKLFQDKTYWGFWQRIVFILTILKLGELKDAKLEIDKLGKSMPNYAEIFDEREIYVFDRVKTYVKETKISKEAKETEIRKPRETKIPQWNLYGPEAIPIDDLLKL